MRRPRIAAALSLLILTSAHSRLSAGGRMEVVGLDPRVELGEIAFWLAVQPRPPKIITPVTVAYIEDVREHFAAHSGHPAVRTAAAFAPPHFPSPWMGFKLRSRILLRLSPPPDLREKRPIPAGTIAPISPEAKDRWVEQLRAFAKSADFDAFFRARAKRYDPHIRNFAGRLAGEDYTAQMEAYTGLKFNGDIRILFAPTLEAGRFSDGESVHEEHEDGRRTIHNIFSTLLLDNLGEKGLPEDVPARLWHETGHALLDPLYMKHREAIDRKRTAKVRPDEWTDYIQDILVQAVALRLFAAHAGAKSAQKQLDYEEKEEQAYLEPLLARLKTYEKERKTYPTLAEFYPELISALP